MVAILREGYENRFVSQYSPSGTVAYGSGYSSGVAFLTNGNSTYDIGVTEFYMRARFQLSGNTNNVDHILFYNESAVLQASVRFGVGVPITLLVNGSVVATAPGNWADAWGRVEVYYNFSDTGQIIIRENGVEIINYTGDTKVSGSLIATMRLAYSAGTNQILIDDVAVNDTSGGTNNSWCGDGHIVMLVPNGNGASSQWTGSDGNSTDNYLLVDDPGSAVPDNDSTYVAASTSSLTDDYAVTDFSIPGGANVQNVWAVGVLRKDSGTTPDVYVGVISNATQSLSSAITPTTVYAVYRSPYLPTDPDTGLAWDQSGINAAKVEVKT